MINININKELHGSYGKMLLNVDLHINKGEFVALSGESGAGKTTLLRILAGLEESNSKIEVDGDIWQDEKYIKPIQKRDIGFVFQNYALFPNLNVINNLLFVKKDKELAKYLLNLTNHVFLVSRQRSKTKKLKQRKTLFKTNIVK